MFSFVVDIYASSKGKMVLAISASFLVVFSLSSLKLPFIQLFGNERTNSAAYAIVKAKAMLKKQVMSIREDFC